MKRRAARPTPLHANWHLASHIIAAIVLDVPTERVEFNQAPCSLCKPDSFLWWIQRWEWEASTPRRLTPGERATRIATVCFAGQESDRLQGISPNRPEIIELDLAVAKLFAPAVPQTVEAVQRATNARAESLSLLTRRAELLDRVVEVLNERQSVDEGLIAGILKPTLPLGHTHNPREQPHTYTGETDKPELDVLEWHLEPGDTIMPCAECGESSYVCTVCGRCEDCGHGPHQ